MSLLLKNLPRRTLFSFSNQEYKANIKTTLGSSKRKHKLLKYNRLDEVECKINVYGMPLFPT
jgi:hypothetical protein